ncbi:MAG TPA: sialidase family protein, partial [Polyangiaceae bacterium]
IGGKLVEGRACRDARNCGLFGRACTYTSAAGACTDGQCAEGVCRSGFYPDETKPLPNCSYACTPTNGGKEICDGRDNDCNGRIDDNADVSSDPLNCGACGTTCIGAFANSEPKCDGGQCVLGACYSGYFSDPNAPSPATVPNCLATCKKLCNFPFAAGVCAADGSCSMGACFSGHYDLNRDSKDGCEYACSPSGFTPPVCNDLDNLCSGHVNEGVNLTSDPLNCGGCGRDCDQYFPNSATSCQASACKWVACKPGYVALNGTGSAGGCQYQCTPTNGGKEICDGLDNDCNGVVDDKLTDAGGSCTTTQPGPCAAGQFACSGGTLKCVSTASPSREICNGVDDDCNGKTDDGPDGTSATLPGVGFACGVKQVGSCQFGTTSCGVLPNKPTGIICQGEIDPIAETCNGKDDDCDGIVDDNLTDSWATTPTACNQHPAPCKAGTFQCLKGSQACVGGIPPSQEICDGTGPGTGTNPSCTGVPGQGCVWPTSPPVRLDTLNNPTQGVASNFQLSSASIGSEYFVAYSGVRPGNNAVANVFTRVSTDAGLTWAGNGDVDATPAANAESEPSVFARTGRAYMVFSRFTNGNGTGNRRIYSRSASATDTPAYASWTNGAGVTQVRIQNNGGIDCFQPTGVVAKSDGTALGAGDWLAATWSEIGGTPTNIQRNVFLAYSKNGGASWSTAAQVNSGLGTDKGQSPVIAADGNGVVYVAWRDERTAGLSQVYFATANVSSVVFPAAPVLSGAVALQPTTGPAAGSATQLALAASGTHVSVAWTDLRSKWSTIRVASSQNGGSSFTQVNGVNDGQIVNPDGLNNNASTAGIAANGANVVIAWEDRRSGNPNIRVNRSLDGGASWLAVTPRVDTGTVNGAFSSLTPSIGFGAPKTTISGVATNSVYVAWQDLRFPASAVLTNVSLDGGLTWAPNAGVAYRMDVDTNPPAAAAGSVADSQSPFVLSTPSQDKMSVVWIDFRNAAGTNGVNGDIWTRLLQ